MIHKKPRAVKKPLTAKSKILEKIMSGKKPHVTKILKINPGHQIIINNTFLEMF